MLARNVFGKKIKNSLIFSDGGWYYKKPRLRSRLYNREEEEIEYDLDSDIEEEDDEFKMKNERQIPHPHRFYNDWIFKKYNYDQT